jgi:hypothetical protein
VCSPARNAHGRLDGRRHPVHRVGTQDDEVRAGPLQRLGRVGQHGACLVPFARMLQLFDIVEIHAEQDDLGRVQAAQVELHRFVDVPVVGNG